MERNAKNRDYRHHRNDSDDGAHEIIGKDENSFASSMSALAYGMNGDGDAATSLAEHVSRNRHKNQRMDGEFMR
jgi:hypothetical protein